MPVPGNRKPAPDSSDRVDLLEKELGKLKLALIKNETDRPIPMGSTNPALAVAFIALLLSVISLLRH